MRLPIPKFKVLLYGPGVPFRGIKAYAHFEESVLVVQGKRHWFTIQGQELQLQLGSFDGRQWVLSCQTPSGQVTAILQGDDAVELFIRLAPHEVSAGLKRLHREQRSKIRKLRYWMALMGFLLLAPTAVLAWFWNHADQSSLWLANQVSQEQKHRLGELALEQLRAKLPLLERGEVLDVVQSVGVRVTTGSRLRYQFHVAVSPEANAIALPGGHVVVYTGLLRELRNADELAGVLAQQASHVEKRHTLARMIHAFGWRGALGVLSGDYSNPIWDAMPTQLQDMRYSVDQEREADTEALLMLRRAGVAAQGLLAYVQRRAVPAKDGMPSIPLPDRQRLANVRAKFGAVPAYQSQPMSIDWQQFQEALASGKAAAYRFSLPLARFTRLPATDTGPGKLPGWLPRPAPRLGTETFASGVCADVDDFSKRPCGLVFPRDSMRAVGND